MRLVCGVTVARNISGQRKSSPAELRSRLCSGRTQFSTHADGVNARAWHPYRCGFCDYSTRYKGNLLVHERIHTGERPFACRLCSHSFSHRSHLTTHLRRHTGERPFVCSLCHRTFTRKNLLGVHFHKHHRGGHSVP
ncbi:hypothetical protein HPB47_011659 [Ixodes persulcatus]|uniref:Uncharacterized protein n=1 Tax=Ixodes persulcatus TaxID=34615 RepID=A0AC60NVW9_IXOPE|nr:hypothetical protein HPB47_011659 [Ixodes persulcatus]